MSAWKTQVTRKTKRRLAKSTSAETQMGPALAKEILAALFQHVPHRGVGAANARPAAGRTQPRQPADGASRAEYQCAGCGTFNWTDRSVCRECRQSRTAGRPAEAGPARRTGPGTRPGAAAAATTVSPGKRAEDISQAVRQAVRAGATAEEVQPIVEKEQKFRLLQAAAKSLKPLDMAREAVEKAAAAVTAADAAIAACEAATVVARQKAADARGRHRDRTADLKRIETIRAETTATGHSSMPAHNLLAKAQSLMASLEGLMNANADSIPETFRKETEEFKAAMVLQATAAAVAHARPAPAAMDTDVRSMVDNTKRLMAMMDSCQRELSNQSGGLPECLVDLVTAVNQSILAVDPVNAPLLGEALSNAAGFPLDLERRGDMVDADMDFSEEGLTAMANAIVEGIGSETIEKEKHFATVMGHLRTVVPKGFGKGKPRPMDETPYGA